MRRRLPKQGAGRKRAWRRATRCPKDERERLAGAVRARALALPELAAAGTVMLVRVVPHRAGHPAHRRWVLEAGKRLCLPRILAPRLMAAFQVADLAADLVPGTWDIPEPREGLPEVPPEEMDLVFVPGSAFDEDGRRCGYGGGFYDNYLPLTRPARRGWRSPSRRRWCRRSRARRTTCR